MKAWTEVALCVVACAGKTSPAELVATVNEPPGANCATGGVAIETGLDVNGNETLDPSEVTSTTYVCSNSSAKELVRVVAEPPGVNCANGGEAIEVGVDANDNYVLDASEVTSTAYVCTGAPGVQTVAAAVPEPAGTNCPDGGQKVETGVDANNNGVLDPNEIAQVSYVCTNASGDQALIRIDAEPAGTNCVAGGSAIRVGFDLNSDGILEDSEIQTTSYLCRLSNPTTVQGGFVVRNSVDAAQLLGVQTITGDLTIDATGLMMIDLTSLTSVGGAFDIINFSGTTIDLPALVSAGTISITAPTGLTTLNAPALAMTSNLSVTNTALASLSLPSLTAAAIVVTSNASLRSVSASVLASTQELSLVSNVALDSLSFPALTSAQSLQINGTGAALTSLSFPLSFPALTSLPYLEVNNDTALTSLDLSTVTTSGDLLIDDNAALTSLDVSHLVSVSGGFGLTDNPALGSLSLPALTTVATEPANYYYFYIRYDNALTSITAPSWTTFGVSPPTAAPLFEISDNPQLATCRAQALAVQVGAKNVVMNNDNAAETCP